ncbi:MAG: hypothetical protein U5J96_18450 [Ignavibacteriaceae bacterium]|nr:hypothetical protein [Ignavibacteriaceae bacterium]
MTILFHRLLPKEILSHFKSFWSTIWIDGVNTSQTTPDTVTEINEESS